MSAAEKSDLASMYYDQHANGTLVVNFARNSAEHGRALTTRFRYPSYLRIGQQRYTQRELDSLKSDIVDSAIAHRGWDVVEVNRDDIGNSIRSWSALSHLLRPFEVLCRQSSRTVRTPSSQRTIGLGGPG